MQRQRRVRRAVPVVAEQKIPPLADLVFRGADRAAALNRAAARGELRVRRREAPSIVNVPLRRVRQRGPRLAVGGNEHVHALFARHRRRGREIGCHAAPERARQPRLRGEQRIAPAREQRAARGQRIHALAGSFPPGGVRARGAADRLLPGVRTPHRAAADRQRLGEQPGVSAHGGVGEKAPLHRPGAERVIERG